VQQNNDSDHYGARKLRGSFGLAREQCESLFCCIDFPNRFDGDGRSWDPWTSNFLVFPFGNRVQQNNDSDHNGARKLRGSFGLAREQCESLFCCIDFPNRFDGDGRSWAIGLLTSWIFHLEIECNKTMIQTQMVRKGSQDHRGWLENSVNHSFVALISRIDLMGMGGLRVLGLLTSWIFLLEIECNKTMIHTQMVRKRLDDPRRWLDSSVRDSINHSLFLK